MEKQQSDQLTVQINDYCSVLCNYKDTKCCVAAIKETIRGNDTREIPEIKGNMH